MNDTYETLFRSIGSIIDIIINISEDLKSKETTKKM